MNYDLIIIGSGPAGIATIEYLINTKLKILMIDSGNDLEIKNYKKDSSTYSGDFKINFDEERKRAFFGTTALWNSNGIGGNFWEFDSMDFENRSNNNQNIKWGISYNEIKEAYMNAQKFLKIEDKEDKLERLITKNTWKNLSYEYSAKVASTYYQNGDEYNQFILEKKRNILNSSNITLMLNTTLDKLILNKKLDRVEKVTLIDKNNSKIEFSCKDIVIATGCFENNKILLKLKNQNKLDIKNLGRFITFHPSIIIGTIPIKKFNLLTKEDLEDLNKVFLLREKRLDLNSNFNYGLSITPQNKSIFLEMEILKKIEYIKNLIIEKKYSELFKYGLKFFISNDFIKYLTYKIRYYFTKIKKLEVGMSFEHLPDCNNYINLSKNDDSIIVNTFINEKNTSLLNSAVQTSQSKLKQIFPNFEKLNIDYKNHKFETNNHHHGGTIIGLEAKRGVVDSNLKLHNIDNIYISGSSVFPNSSIYNPTYTIIAMGLRLSKYILSRSN